MLTRQLLRLRNLALYWYELGLAGTVALLRQRAQNVQMFVLPVKGFSTPVYCRSQGSDFTVLRQVLGHQDAAIRFDVPPTLIVDAGANVGYSSLLFARHYPDATIVAIEPDEQNCTMFLKNCAAYPNIRLLQGALWPHTTRLAITNPTADSYMFQVSESPSANDSAAVPAYTLPLILQMSGLERISLLKLDIEGAEHALFTGDAEAWLSKVDVILVELHDRYVPGCSAAFSAMLHNVEHSHEKRGEYECVRLLSSDNPLFPFPDRLSSVFTALGEKANS